MTNVSADILSARASTFLVNPNAPMKGCTANLNAHAVLIVAGTAGRGLKSSPADQWNRRACDDWNEAVNGGAFDKLAMRTRPYTIAAMAKAWLQWRIKQLG